MGKTDTLQIPTFAAAAGDYEADFHAWLVEQGSRLRLLRVPGIDTENLAEEIEALGRGEKRELLSRCEVLLLHLLKWHHRSSRRGSSWRTTIGEQRGAIELVLQDSPSLRPTLSEVVGRAYPRAVRKASVETGLPASSFPHTCEWSVHEVLDDAFLPA